MARFASVTHTERGLDRLINFSDAVIAIAATLLILPLVEIVNDALSGEGGLSGLNEPSIRLQASSFTVTFFVMTAYWRSHHEMFERVKDYSRGLVALNFLWLSSMVFLAFPSGFLYDPNDETVALYLFNLSLISVTLRSTRLYIYRHPELLVDPEQKLKKEYSVTTFIWPVVLIFTALAGLLFGPQAYYLLLLVIPIRYFTRGYRPPPPPHTERGMDRVVNFSDAVVAIAITLLILPLVDIITDSRGDAQDLSLSSIEVIAKILTFALTFYFMSRQWLINHRLFENIKDYSPILIRITYWWLFFMVIFAIPSALVGEEAVQVLSGRANEEVTQSFPLAFFAFSVVLALISLTSAITIGYLQRHPKLLIDPKQRLSPRVHYFVAVLFLVAGVVPILGTAAGYEQLGFGLWIVGLSLPLVVRRLAARQDAVKRSTRTPSEM